MKEHYNIEGMTCSACSNIIEKTLSKKPGVNNVTVNLLSNSMDIEYDNDKLNDSIIKNTISNLGYKAILPNDNQVKKYTNEALDMKQQLILSVIFMLILFYISMGHMINLPLPNFIIDNPISFALTQFILAIPIYYLNKKYFINGFKSLSKGHPNMDSLIAIGSLASLIYSIYVVYKLSYAMNSNDISILHQLSHDLYFETGAMILTLISVGKYLESKSKKKTSEAISKLVSLQAKMALVRKNNEEILIPAENVQIGDIEIIKQGEIIPNDGIIILGSTTIDESMITGESIPIEKSINDKVIGATINQSGYIEIEVTNTTENSTLAQIIKLVENAANSKAPIAKFADKVSGIFVPSVITISLFTFIGWFLYTKNIETSLNFAISVLVISCPCALGLATPVSIMVATGVGANNGILIKSADILETTNKIKTIILDKTGTITSGKVKITNVEKFDDSLELIAYSLEKQSSHPLAKAITEAYDFTPLIFDSFNFVAGNGIIGKINDDIYLGGNTKLLTNQGIDLSPYLSTLDKYSSLGYTNLIFAKNKTVLGIISVADTIKKSSIQAIKQFKKDGIKVIMLTGDNHKVAQNIANIAGIDQFVAEVLPQDKQKYVENYKKDGLVMMVGDGINDSPALSSSDIGVAIGSGSDIAIDSADVILVKDNLLDVANLIKLSHFTMLNIKENLFWALIYNTIGIPLAAGLLFIPFGLKLNPMFGAFAMSISSITVVSNALRIRNFKTINEIRKKELKMTKIITVEGMMCMHCKKHVEDALNNLNGVTCTVDLEAKTATCTITSEITDDVLTKTIEAAGYKVLNIK